MLSLSRHSCWYCAETTSQTWTVATAYRLCSRPVAGLGGVEAVEGEWPGWMFSKTRTQPAQNQPILGLSCSAPGRAEEPACAGAWWRSGVSGSRWAKSIRGRADAGILQGRSVGGLCGSRQKDVVLVLVFVVLVLVVGQSAT